MLSNERKTAGKRRGDFNSGGSPAWGYVWYHLDGATLGDMTISGNVNLTGSRRVVLLVDGADFQ